jgi:periplasmic divalent cation tolerance protein
MADPAAEFVIVLCTTPNPEIAASLARGLVEQRLGACANIVAAVRSIYAWQGEVKDDSESLMVIKTRRALFAQLAEWLKQHHPYEEPEIIALPIVEGSASYLAWVAAQTLA